MSCMSEKRAHRIQLWAQLIIYVDTHRSVTFVSRRQSDYSWRHTTRWIFNENFEFLLEK